MVAIVIVQQHEGNVVQPLVVGRAVDLHAVVIVLAVTAGAVLWGLVGAFVAVPATAVAFRAFSHVRARASMTGADERGSVDSPVVR